MKTKNVKLLFYLLTFMEFFAVIGIVIVGCKLNILGKVFKDIPKHKLYIFYSYNVALAVFTFFYIKFNSKYDYIISRKNHKKRL